MIFFIRMVVSSVCMGPIFLAWLFRSPAYCCWCWDSFGIADANKSIRLFETPYLGFWSGQRPGQSVEGVPMNRHLRLRWWVVEQFRHHRVGRLRRSLGVVWAVVDLKRVFNFAEVSALRLSRPIPRGKYLHSPALPPYGSGGCSSSGP